MTSDVPVLEIGGTHVTAALVSLSGSATKVVKRLRATLASDAPCNDIVDQLATAAASLGVSDARAWGVAVPGPFDYAAGIGRFSEVGKFDALNGVDLGAALRAAIPARPDRIAFINDADAFGLGESAAGAASDHARSVCITLGTGVGSAFIAGGVATHHGRAVPPDGSAHLLRWEGRPLEDTVSRRAIRARYRELSGKDLDVHEIARAARAGEQLGRRILDDSMCALGMAIAPWIESFEATAVVVGGSIGRSWDLLEQPLRIGVSAVRPGLGHVAFAAAALGDDAALIGASLSVSP